jgi:hypothetical protein
VAQPAEEETFHLGFRSLRMGSPQLCVFFCEADLEEFEDLTAALSQKLWCEVHVLILLKISVRLKNASGSIGHVLTLSRAIAEVLRLQRLLRSSQGHHHRRESGTGGGRPTPALPT